MKSWKTPTPEQVARAVALLGHAEQYRYFFDRLENPLWIEPLQAKGFFNAPPQAMRDEARGTISFPPWPASQYLARMAEHVPEIVLKVILQISDTDNIHVHGDLANAALAMPAEMAAKWAKIETKWVEQHENLYFLLPEKLGALAGHLAKGGQVKAALDLARSLLAVLPDPWATDKTGEEETYHLLPESRAHFDTWHYKQILEKNMPDLVAAAGESTLALLCDLLDSAIRLSRSHEEEGPEDFSYIWRPAIEDHEQNRSYDLKNLLVSAVRNAVEQVARADPSQVPALVEDLEQRPWRVFQRITFHLLRVCPDATLSLIAKRLTDLSLFDQVDFRHEYVLLARDRFAHLPQDDQKKILGRIAAGPNLERFKARKEQYEGRRPTDEEAERDAKRWQLRHLAPLRDALPPEWRQRYDEWVAELGEPESPEFVSHIVSWAGPTSPKSAEDLRSMSVQEIIAFLKTWQPPGDFRSPSPEGLERELSTLVTSDPERFAVDAGRFQGLDPTYVHAFLSGLRDAAKEKRAFSWLPVLWLCCWMMEQPREIPERKSKYAHLDPGWVWTRKAIADLLSGGFEVGPAEIPFDLRTSVWNVLKPITDDPQPTPEYEARYGGSNRDPATLSINTTRGEAMHAVVRYALWVRQHVEKAPDGKERVESGFDEMPEVREVLDAHLDPARDPAFSIRAVYGQWFPWLVLLDRNWAVARVSQIFPLDESLRDLRDAAWETYIVFCEPYDSVFEVLCEEYRHAVERIGTGGTKWRHLADPEERLAEHLMILYWRGRLSLDEPDGLLARFYAKACDKLCGHAFSVEGRRLCNAQETTVPPEILDRLKALWECRLAAAKSATSPSSHAAELAAFGWWFASRKFNDKFNDAWAITHLTEILMLLRFVGKVDADRQVVEHLAALTVDMPLQAVECLGLIVEGDKEGWAIHGWREHARTILATAIQSDNAEAREAATMLVHRLGARGYLEFRDLLT